MAFIDDVNNLILVSIGYQLELGGELYSEQRKGCIDCFDASKIEQLEWLIDSLNNQIERQDYGEVTNRLYACLLSAVGNYSGASLTVDGNASVPNTTIIVEGGSGDNRPSWIDVDWSDITNDVDGYRDTYFNADWIGWNPMIQIGGVVMYQVGIDYDNDGQGTITFREGKGLYNGSYFRAGNYQPYTAPIPSVSEYRLLNNSSIETSYYVTESLPLISGQEVHSPFVTGDVVIGQIQEGQLLVFTRYLANGDIDTTLELTNPPSFQLSTSIMEEGKTYEFIYTDLVTVEA